MTCARNRFAFTSALIAIVFLTNPLDAQVNLEWNEALLESIRNDVPRPTVHARNLYHHSLGMHNAFAAVNEGGDQLEPPIELATVVDYDLNLLWSGFSYAFISQRYGSAPGWLTIEENMAALIQELHADSPEQLLMSDWSFARGHEYGLELDAFYFNDGSNQASDYANTCYTPVNDPLMVDIPVEGAVMNDGDHWQPLDFSFGAGQDFLGANWCDVVPFALNPDSAQLLERSGCVYRVYEDPGSPNGFQDEGTDLYGYINGFTTVVLWQQQLDASAEDEWLDISPRSQGNFGDYPDIPEIYYSWEGPNLGPGHAYNPVALDVYDEEWVLKSDFSRVLPEFWADGPNSETPPGHWFSILNHQVFLDPGFQPLWKGEQGISGEEWLSRAYLLMGGALHDCAVAVWGVKAYYDFVRPISAIRHMQSLGQSSDPNLSNYHPHGLPLVEGVIEVIEAGDALLTEFPDALGQIKIKQWVPMASSESPASFEWRPGCHWMPYQLPSFVTPPFAGYVSGHSTFSSAAAELLTEMTGSAFFPSGIGRFQIDLDFLNFDLGPTQTFELQWATYKDAADQSGLSRIWGGIHPPIDDVRGRNIGISVAKQALEKGAGLFEPDAMGCTYVMANNYNPSSLTDDGSCLFSVTETCFGDLNGDNAVTSGDLLQLLAVFTMTCP